VSLEVDQIRRSPRTARLPVRRAPTAQLVNWVVKASKLCNLRCRYCYEWNELGDTARLSLPGWERLLKMVKAYHRRRVAAVGKEFRTCIIWHGGEPMLLPVRYLESVMELQRTILGKRALDRGDYYNAVQTNLYSIVPGALDLFQRERFQIGVSMDFIGGVRLSAGGRETEDRVVENMERLRRRGVAFGAIVVLAGHTCSNIIAAYDFYETIGVDLRVLPLFDAPLNVPGANFAASTTEMTEALCALFDHWIRRRNPVSVAPLDEYIRAVYLKMRGAAQAPYDRRRGEWAWLVNTDGTLYQVMDAYDPGRALGNVFVDKLDDVLDSPAYAASLAADDALFQRHCGPCEFLGACNSFPLFYSPRKGSHPARCHIAYEVTKHIDKFFRSNNWRPQRIRALLN
jgi:uncharacterized protein